MTVFVVHNKCRYTEPLSVNHQCDRHTVGKTDIIAIAIACVWRRALKIVQNPRHHPAWRWRLHDKRIANVIAVHWQCQAFIIVALPPVLKAASFQAERNAFLLCLTSETEKYAKLFCAALCYDMLIRSSCFRLIIAVKYHYHKATTFGSKSGIVGLNVVSWPYQRSQ